VQYLCFDCPGIRNSFLTIHIKIHWRGSELGIFNKVYWTLPRHHVYSMYIIKPTLNYNCQQCVTGSRQAILWPWGECSSEVFCSSRIQSLVLRMFCIYEKMQTSQSVKTKTDYLSVLTLFLVCMRIRKTITSCLFSLKKYYQSHLKLSLNVFWERS